MRKLWLQFINLFPSKLPVGVTEFHAWAESFLEIYDLPTKDVDSVKYTLATILMHLGPQVAYKPKFYFFITMKAAAAKQIAGAVFREIKERQAEAQKAAQNEQNIQN